MRISRLFPLVLAALPLVVTACEKKEDKVWVTQRAEADLPGLRGRARVRVGDVLTEGYADVSILAGNGTVLAGKAEAKEGERIPFELDGKRYELEIVTYDLHLTSEDSALVRVHSGKEQ
ncbi:MAG: hypothetical protein HYV63_20580 [Candidatus Schekmanbacteria bacterium]|nr:hypothetical protein [Candidatus Schekmanbacteria bacterium]